MKMNKTTSQALPGTQARLEKSQRYNPLPVGSSMTQDALRLRREKPVLAVNPVYCPDLFVYSSGSLAPGIAGRSLLVADQMLFLLSKIWNVFCDHSYAAGRRT
jgi:hypothetical protein